MFVKTRAVQDEGKMDFLVGHKRLPVCWSRYRQLQHKLLNRERIPGRYQDIFVVFLCKNKQSRPPRGF